jgi:hypothetical protein
MSEANSGSRRRMEFVTLPELTPFGLRTAIQPAGDGGGAGAENRHGSLDRPSRSRVNRGWTSGRKRLPTLMRSSREMALL